MKYYLDTANISDIQKILNVFPIEGVTTAEIGDLRGGDALVVHMHHKRFQRVIRPFVRRDRLLVKIAVPVPGNRQRQLPKFGFQRALVRAVAGIAGTNAGRIVLLVIQKRR